MRPHHLLTAFLLAALPASAAPAVAAPAVAAPAVAAPAAAAAGIAVTDAAGHNVTLTAAALAHLPQTRVAVAFTTAHGTLKASFCGPLLWVVLAAAHAIDPHKPGPAIREAVTATGADGYTAVLALGELAPFLENKQVILAETMNGRPLGPSHLRVVVPGDGHGARSVRDVVRLAILAPS